MASSRSKSPCVRNCCLNEQDICLGCFRHLSEIKDWNKLSEKEKEKVLASAHKRRIAYLDKHPSAKPL